MTTTGTTTTAERRTGARSRDTAAAGIGHARQFDPQRPQPAQLVLDERELGASQRVRLLARAIRAVGEGEQRAHRVEREAEFAGVADEVQARQVAPPIHPVAAPRARRWRQ